MRGVSSPWHSTDTGSQVFNFSNCIDDTSTETGLMALILMDWWCRMNITTWPRCRVEFTTARTLHGREMKLRAWRRCALVEISEMWKGSVCSTPTPWQAHTWRFWRGRLSEGEVVLALVLTFLLAVTGVDLLGEKNTNGWLVAGADLVWEKNIVAGWQHNRASSRLGEV